MITVSSTSAADDDGSEVKGRIQQVLVFTKCLLKGCTALVHSTSVHTKAGGLCDATSSYSPLPHPSVQAYCA